MSNSSQVVPSDRVRGKEHRLNRRRFRIDIRKNFTRRMIKHWHRSPKMGVESPSFEILKTQLGMLPELPSLPTALTLLWGAGLDESVSRRALQHVTQCCVFRDGLYHSNKKQNNYFF